jgi:AcrR family transcriptional regulator
MSTSRERIVAAATQEITRKGPLGLRIQDVASGAGVSVPLIYKYFTDRDGLLVATLGTMLEQRVNGFISQVEQFMASTPDLTLEDMVDVMSTQAAAASKEIRWLRLRALAAASEIPALRERLRTGQLAIDRRAEEFAENVRRRLGLSGTMTSRQLAFLMQAVSFSRVLDDLHDGEDALTEEDHRALVRALLRAGLQS